VGGEKEIEEVLVARELGEGYIYTRGKTSERKIGIWEKKEHTGSSISRPVGRGHIKVLRGRGPAKKGTPGVRKR